MLPRRMTRHVFEMMLMLCSDFTDTTTVSNSCILDSAIYWLYEGNDNGDEPTKTASAPDSKVCATNSEDERVLDVIALLSRVNVLHVSRGISLSLVYFVLLLSIRAGQQNQ